MVNPDEQEILEVSHAVQYPVIYVGQTAGRWKYSGVGGRTVSVPHEYDGHRIYPQRDEAGTEKGFLAHLGEPKHRGFPSAVGAGIYETAVLDPDASVHWYGSSGLLYLFEAPIDMLSFISMNKEGWKQHSYAACCGVSDRVAMQLLKDDPRIKRVCICLDNDEEGRKSSKRIKGNLESKGVQVDILVPKLKDWNEDLLLKQRISRREPEEKTVDKEITSDETEDEQCPALAQ